MPPHAQRRSPVLALLLAALGGAACEDLGFVEPKPTGHFISTCPESLPWASPGATCTKALTCEVWAESCCNRSFYSSCKCAKNGPLVCVGGLDHCMDARSMCSGNCDQGYFEVGGKCRLCSEISGGYVKALGEALASRSSCASDSDCGSIEVSGCVAACALPVGLGNEASLSSAVADIQTSYCPQISGGRGCIKDAGCQSGKPRCVQGLCRLVAL